VSEFTDHLKKDMRLLTSDSLFVILLVVIAVIAFISAFTAASSYVSSTWGWQQFVTRHMIENNQLSALNDYWQSVNSIYAVIFLVISSMALTAEKESGMVRYILTFKTSKRDFYLSKYLVLLGICGYAVFVSLIAYIIVFSAMDISLLNAGIMISSVIFPFLTVLVFASIGLAISALTQKKGATIAIAVVLFFIISIMFSVSLNLGTSAADQVNPHSTSANITQSMPIIYKLLIYANPIVLYYGAGQALGSASGYDSGGTALFDMWGGVILGLIMMFVYLMLGMILFSRERTERGLFNDLKGRLRRKNGPW
jgi:ABC-type transport system involved in multi-copper enzyme maturation permease subunit